VAVFVGLFAVILATCFLGGRGRRTRERATRSTRSCGSPAPCSRVSLNRVASSWSPPPGCSRATSRWRRRRRPRIKRRRAPFSRTSASGSERCRRRASAGAVRRVAQVGV